MGRNDRSREVPVSRPPSAVGGRLAMNGERVVMAGGNGFLGKVLGRHLADRDYQVVILSRRPVVGGGGGDGRGRVTQVFWDGRAAGEWVRELDGARAVINLAGRSVNCRYNEANRRAILDSRLDRKSVA